MTPKASVMMLRHGRTQLNDESRTVGSIDVPLNLAGRVQARKVGWKLFFDGARFSVIKTSPLSRARETAAFVATWMPKIPVVIDDRLRERCVGKREGQLETPADDERLLNPNGPQPEGAEPYDVFDARVVEVFEELTATANGHTLLVTHGLWTIHALKHIRGWTTAETPSHVHQIPGNCVTLKFWIGLPCKCGSKFYEMPTS